MNKNRWKNELEPPHMGGGGKQSVKVCENIRTIFEVKIPQQLMSWTTTSVTETSFSCSLQGSPQWMIWLRLTLCLGSSSLTLTLWVTQGVWLA